MGRREKGRELYDHASDPKERTNLADEPAQTEIVAKLSEQLRAAYAETYPKSGSRPAKRTGVWAPNLTNPVVAKPVSGQP